MIILWSLAVAGATILVHSVICSLPGPGGTVARFIAVAALAAAVFAAFAIHAFGFTANTVSGLLVFAFCCELYLFLITLSFASVSANVLTRLLDGPLTTSALGRIYSGASMSASRVERLKRAELVTETEAGLTLSRRGRAIVSLMSAMRRLFGHEPTRERAHPTATG